MSTRPPPPSAHEHGQAEPPSPHGNAIEQAPDFDLLEYFDHGIMERTTSDSDGRVLSDLGVEQAPDFDLLEYFDHGVMERATSSDSIGRAVSDFSVKQAPENGLPTSNAEIGGTPLAMELDGGEAENEDGDPCYYTNVDNEDTPQASVRSRLVSALKRSVAACLSAGVKIPPVYPERHYTFGLSWREVEILMRTSAHYGLNRIKTPTAWSDTDIDHVIALPELDVSCEEAVQIWRSIAMWDPMRRKDNQSKGGGKYIFIVHDKKLFHNSSRRTVDESKELQERWDWVRQKFGTFGKFQDSECLCGVCAAQQKSDLTPRQEQEQSTWLLNLLYHEFLHQSSAHWQFQDRTMSDVHTSGYPPLLWSENISLSPNNSPCNQNTPSQQPSPDEVVVKMKELAESLPLERTADKEAPNYEKLIQVLTAATSGTKADCRTAPVLELDEIIDKSVEGVVASVDLQSYGNGQQLASKFKDHLLRNLSLDNSTENAAQGMD